MAPFQYTPFVNPAAGTIADLMQRGPAARAAALERIGQIQANAAQNIGQANANAQLQSGQAWAGAIQGITGALANVPAQLGQAQIAQQKQAIGAEQLKALTAQNADATRLRAGQQALAGVMQGDTMAPGAMGPRQESYLDANGLFDVPKITQSLGRQGFGDMAGTLVKSAESINDSVLTHQKLAQQTAQAHTVLLGDLADGTLKLTKTGVPIEQALDFAASPALAAGTFDTKTYAAAKQRILSLPPEQQQAALTTFMDHAAKLAPTKTLGKDATETDRYGRVIASNVVPEKPPPPSAAGFAQTANDPTKTPEERAAAQAMLDAVQKTPGQEETIRHNQQMEKIGLMTAGREVAAQQETARHNRVTEASTAGDKTDLSPAGLDAAATMFAKTGQLPALGNGDKTTRKQIINRAAELMPGLDIASAKADYAANTASLKTMQGQRDAIGSFEKTAGKNLDIFLESAGKIVDTGSPLANTAARFVTGKMLGSTDQAAYDAARQVAINEIAKITSNPNLAGTLSDSARHEVDAFNPTNATLAQTVTVARLLKRDMGNRISSIDDAVSGIQDRITKGAPGTTTKPATPPPAGATTTPKADPLGLFK